MGFKNNLNDLYFSDIKNSENIETVITASENGVDIDTDIDVDNKIETESLNTNEITNGVLTATKIQSNYVKREIQYETSTPANDLEIEKLRIWYDFNDTRCWNRSSTTCYDLISGLEATFNQHDGTSSNYHVYAGSGFPFVSSSTVVMISNRFGGQLRIVGTDSDFLNRVGDGTVENFTFCFIHYNNLDFFSSNWDNPNSNDILYGIKWNYLIWYNNTATGDYFKLRAITPTGLTSAHHDSEWWVNNNVSSTNTNPGSSTVGLYYPYTNTSPFRLGGWDTWQCVFMEFSNFSTPGNYTNLKIYQYDNFSFDYTPTTPYEDDIDLQGVAFVKNFDKISSTYPLIIGGTTNSFLEEDSWGSSADAAIGPIMFFDDVLTSSERLKVVDYYKSQFFGQ
jgi:hypothetical protein